MKKKTLEQCRTFEDIEDNGLMFEYFNSKEFKESIKKSIEKETWDKGLPKIYLDENGWIVEHWKDGKITKISKIK